MSESSTAYRFCEHCFPDHYKMPWVDKTIGYHPDRDFLPFPYEIAEFQLVKLRKGESLWSGYYFNTYFGRWYMGKYDDLKRYEANLSAVRAKIAEQELIRDTNKAEIKERIRQSKVMEAING